MRNEKTYNGQLMAVGKANEEIILEWLKTFAPKEVIDFREWRIAQRLDVDCGIETIDGAIVLAEIKADNYIGEGGNLLFEVFRINHFVRDKWFYLGWGWRSPAKKLIIRNPKTNEIFVFDFEDVRIRVGQWVAERGRQIEYDKKINVTETDKQKTTFNFIIPLSLFQYQKHCL